MGGSHLDPSDRDSVLKNTKFVLVELGELDSTLRGDLARIKAFLSECTDVIRKPYGKSDEEYHNVLRNGKPNRFFERPNRKPPFLGYPGRKMQYQQTKPD